MNKKQHKDANGFYHEILFHNIEVEIEDCVNANLNGFKTSGLAFGYIKKILRYYPDNKSVFHVVPCKENDRFYVLIK